MIAIRTKSIKKLSTDLSTKLSTTRLANRLITTRKFLIYECNEYIRNFLVNINMYYYIVLMIKIKYGIDNNCEICYLYNERN